MQGIKLQSAQGASGGDRDIPNLDQLRHFVQMLQKDDSIGSLLRSCNEIGEAYLFGGAVRDVIFGSKGRFGDLDIFVSGPLDVDFVRSLATMSRRTNFGGLRLVVGKFDVDIWELPKSYAFQVKKGLAVSIPNLLKTVCFSTDAAAVSLLDPKKFISTSKFRDSVQSRTVSFVSRPVDIEILQAVRVARLFVKSDILPGRDVAAYYCRAVERYGLDALVEAEVKWKGRRVLDQHLVKEVFEIAQGSSLEIDLFSRVGESVRP